MDSIRTERYENMAMNEKETREKRGNPEKRGFYVALAICIAAIGIAAWSTYDTVSGFLEPEESNASSAVASTDDDPESSVSSGHGNGSASAVTVKPDAEAAATAEPSPAATPAPVESTPESAAENANTAPAYTVSDGFRLPVSAETVVTAFSEAPMYSATMRDYRAHMGVDFAAAHGETVHAAANGIVKDTYTDMLLGNTIVIEHGGYTFYYCGLGETFLVEPGETVEAGQDIGSVTAAPFESVLDPHLHLEVKQDGAAIDPAPLFETE